MQGEQHARDLIAELGRVAFTANVDGHESDEILLESSPRSSSRRFSAPLVVAITKSVTVAPRAFAARFDVGERDAGPQERLFDARGTVERRATSFEDGGLVRRRVATSAHRP